MVLVYQKKNRVKGTYKVYGSNGVVGSHDEYLVAGPAIIIGRKGTIGAVSFEEDNFWAIDTTYFVNREPKEYKIKWLYYALQALRLDKLNRASGTPGLNRDDAYSQSILLPPLDEQKYIADILSTLDREINLIEQIIAKTEKLKKGLMQELFTKGIGHSKFKKTEIGEIPEGWSMKRIDDIADVFTGKTPSRSRKENYSDSGVPWVKSTEVNYLFIENTSEYITEEAFRKEKMPLIPKGSILLAMYGQGITRGRVGVLATDATTNQAIASIVIRDNSVDNLFLYRYLEFSYEFLRTIGHGGNQKNLNSKIVKKLFIPVPEIEEQKQIVKIISEVDEKVKINKQLKIKLTELKKGLMQDLLSGKVRVS